MARLSSRAMLLAKLPEGECFRCGSIEAVERKMCIKCTERREGLLRQLGVSESSIQLLVHDVGGLEASLGGGE